jgi:hypothetical protein
MKTIRIAFVGLLLSGLCSLLCVSCATKYYAGEKRPKEELATLKENPKQYLAGYAVSIFEVNGQEVHNATFGIDVPPGRTHVTVLVHGPITRSNPNGYRSVNRSFTARKGYEYIFEVHPGSSPSQPKLVMREEAR